MVCPSSMEILSKEQGSTSAVDVPSLFFVSQLAFVSGEWANVNGLAKKCFWHPDVSRLCKTTSVGRTWQGRIRLYQQVHLGKKCTAWTWWFDVQKIFQGLVNVPMFYITLPKREYNFQQIFEGDGNKKPKKGHQSQPLYLHIFWCLILPQQSRELHQKS